LHPIIGHSINGQGADVMNDWRTKIAVFAVVLGLGGLGGYAMSASRKVDRATTTAAVPTTQVIRRTVHPKPKHNKRAAGANPGVTPARSLTSTPVSTGSSGSASSSPPVSTGTSGSGGGGGSVHTGTSGAGGGGGESEGGGGGGGGEREGGGD
jgi:hypothetical protein